jgi:ethanolaminephosphotransferase
MLYVVAAKLCNCFFFPFFDDLDDQKLRALQLNSWQLFRLLQAQLPDLSCRNFPCDSLITDSGPTISECKGSKEKLFCCLYLNAAALHDAWRAEVVIKYATILLFHIFTKFYKKYLPTSFHLSFVF